VRKAFVVFLAVLTSGCTEQSTPAREQAQGAALVFVDLSSSLSASEKMRLAGITAATLKSLSKNTRFAVYAMEGSMGNATPLLQGTTPNPFNTTQKFEARKEESGWVLTLQTAIEDLITTRAMQHRELTSCYIKSTAFVQDYFNATGVKGMRMVVWIGDLIEDCIETRPFDYRPFRLTQPNALAALQKLPPKTYLKEADLLAVMIDRAAADPPSEVDAATSTRYWRELIPLLGGDASHFRVGSPPMLNIVPVSGP
jgi:hypothetical protein